MYTYTHLVVFFYSFSPELLCYYSFFFSFGRCFFGGQTLIFKTKYKKKIIMYAFYSSIEIDIYSRYYACEKQNTFDAMKKKKM